MRVSKLGDGLAVEIPADVAASLDLKEGDEVELSRIEREVPATSAKMTRQEALDRLSNLRWKLPVDYKFDRDEANER